MVDHCIKGILTEYIRDYIELTDILSKNIEFMDVDIGSLMHKNYETCYEILSDHPKIRED